MLAQPGVACDRADDRRGIGKSRCLDDSTRKAWLVRVARHFHQAIERTADIFTARAAHAAVADQFDVLCGVHHQPVVEAGLAEFVDDHARALAARTAQKTLYQRRLPAAEKAGDDK